jgi:hypothetical protein
VAVAVGLVVVARVERGWVLAVVAVAYGGFTVIVNSSGLGRVPTWVVPPVAGIRDYFYAPAVNLLVLALVLFAGAALCSRHERRAATPA